MTWRVGTKLGRTLYRDEVLVGMVDTPELAAEIVARMNRTEAEQAVLDAMGDVPEQALRRHVAEATTCDLPEPCRAELARRGLKP